MLFCMYLYVFGSMYVIYWTTYSAFTWRRLSSEFSIVLFYLSAGVWWQFKLVLFNVWVLTFIWNFNELAWQCITSTYVYYIFFIETRRASNRSFHLHLGLSTMLRNTLNIKVENTKLRYYNYYLFIFYSSGLPVNYS